MTSRAGYYRYWGKARPGHNAPCHLLVYHSLDVAACAQVLLARHSVWRRALATATGCAEEMMPRVAARIMALHDIGKFGYFQSKAPEALRHLIPDARLVPEVAHHTHAGWVLWQTLHTELEKPDATALMRAAIGHHGEPPSLAHPTAVRSLRRGDCFDATQEDDARAFARAVFALLSEAAPPLADGSAVEAASWWFAGIGIVADWLGSDTQWFPYRDDVVALEAYWADTLASAERAVEACGIVPKVPTRGLDWAALFPFAPTPCQAAVARLAFTEPVCLVIEDVMGSGKTEAALYAAQRMMQAGLGQGIFFGLPTQATANGLFQRVGEVYQRLFSDKTSLILTHSGRDFVDLGGDTATSRASAWIADMNKKSLLAQVGVGTIDQALLGVLHTRHSTLRLAGLVGKVLVVDEVHSYDAYTNGLLEQLLEAHGRFGGSAILLSATLDSGTRARLLNAWRRGRRLPEVPTLLDAGYPLISVATAEPDVNITPAVPVRLRRHVHVALCHDRDRLLDLVARAARRDKCVAWVCNTVADAIAIHDALLSRLKTRVHLLHARYMAGHRAQLEARLLRRFGKASRRSERRGRVVVATQVIEQSLDVDFDILVSDAAPIDVVLQRIGRCQRHARGFRVARVFVSCPKLENPKADWLLAWGKTAYVYPDHGLVWRSLDLLRRSPTLQLPEDARRLVEAAYGEKDVAVPEPLRDSSRRARDQAVGARARALQAAVRIEAGYVGGHQWIDDADVTREGRPMTELVLFRRTGPLLWPREAAKVRAPGHWSSNRAARTASWEAAVEIGEPVRRDGKSVRAQYDVRRGLLD